MNGNIKNVNEITLYKNLKKRLREEELFNRFEMEPVEESKELELIQKEKGTIIEIDVSYEVEEEENIEFNGEINVNCINETSKSGEYLVDDYYEMNLNEIITENVKLKEKIEKLEAKNLILEKILTREQKDIFHEGDMEYLNKTNKLTNAEKLLLAKREELSRRSNIRKKGWLKQMLG